METWTTLSTLSVLGTTPLLDMVAILAVATAVATGRPLGMGMAMGFMVLVGTLGTGTLGTLNSTATLGRLCMEVVPTVLLGMVLDTPALASPGTLGLATLLLRHQRLPAASKCGCEGTKGGRRKGVCSVWQGCQGAMQRKF